MEMYSLMCRRRVNLQRIGRLLVAQFLLERFYENQSDFLCSPMRYLGICKKYENTMLSIISMLSK